MVVCSRSFRRQLEYLSRHFTIITFKYLLQLAQNDQRLNWPRALAIVTFDDGYRDNLMIAAPILEDLGITACFFVTTGYIGSERRFAWDRDGGLDSPLMSWQDVQELRRRGFEIGSHSVTHRRMSELSHEEFEDELAESRRVLETQIGERVRLFAYPFGRFRDYSASRRQIVGGFYDIANTSIRGLNRLERLTLLELRRTAVSGMWSQAEFCAEADGVFDFVDEFRRAAWQFRLTSRRRSM
jgi:peptidoglycan/xylan/chitin deacetylase (PgdA/CDA1 family)